MRVLSLCCAAVLTASVSALVGCNTPEPSPETASGANTDQLEARGMGRMGRMGQHWMDRFQEQDMNKDGTVTLDEARSAAQARFSAADTSKDGFLDEAEFIAMRPKGMPGPSTGDGDDQSGKQGAGERPMRNHKLARFDENKDGKVSAEEYLKGAQAHFSMADTNHDNTVTQEEMQAARPGPGMRGGANRPGPGMMEQRFNEADANHDGTVTRAEVDAMRAQHFASADTNRDGSLDSAELSAWFTKMHGAALRFDRNQDGKVGKDEAPPFLSDRFEQLDTDKDGQLTAQELEAFAPHRGKMGRGPMGPARMDANSDGKVSQEEFGSMAAQWFTHADINADGSVTLDELQKARPGLRAR